MELKQSTLDEFVEEEAEEEPLPGRLPPGMQEEIDRIDNELREAIEDPSE